MQEGIHLGISRYPETLRVELGVTAMGVESPEGTFIQTGAQLQRVRSATDLSGGYRGAGGGPWRSSGHRSWVDEKGSRLPIML